MKRGPAMIITLAAAFGALASCARQQSPRDKTLAALPDWSGVWQSPATFSVMNPSGRVAGGDDMAVFQRLVPLLHRPPLQPKPAQIYDSIMNDPKALAAGAAGAKICRMGFPLIMDWFNSVQIAVTAELTYFIFIDGEVRYIYTDGRNHPSGDDLLPSDLGDSVGHWEGDTLVIDTIGRTAGSLKVTPVMLDESAHFVERVRRLDENTLVDEMTIDDPAQFTQPWKLSFKYNKLPGKVQNVPFNCDENDRNPVVNGVVTIVPAK